MKKLIILFLLATASHFSIAEVTGHAFLEGQTDHSGIKIKFIPYSPSAQLDSTYSSTTGYFNITINPGVYTIEYSKDGYLSQFYNQGNYITLYGNEFLAPITLIAYSGNYVSGSVSGTWTNEVIYYIVGDVYVSSGNSLIIEAGTVIKLFSNCNFEVNGMLNVNGTEENPVLFTTDNNYPIPGSWGYLEFNNTDNSLINNCIIECGTSIEIYQSDLVVTNCEIRNFSIGTYCAQSTPVFDQCKFQHCYEYFIYFNNCDNFIFINNQLIADQFNSGFRGIVMFDAHGLIENNKFVGGSNTADDNYAIYIDNLNGWDTLYIYNNLIYHFEYGIFSFCNDKVVIINNVINSNYNYGITIPYGRALVQCNCITNNYAGIESLGDYTNIEISYNNIWNNQTNLNTNIPGLGQIVTTNNNGDPSDPYFNIFLDPLFVDTNTFNFHVYESSPAIDAGDNDNIISQYDFDGNPRILDGNDDGIAIVDIGAYEVPVELILTSDFSCPDSVCANDDVTIQYLGNVIAGATFNWDFNDGTIASGSGPGPYQIYWVQSGIKTISLFVTLGYNSSDTTYNTIEVLPVFDVSITINASSNPICFGDEVTFTAFPVNGGETPSFQWKLNTQNVGTNSPVYTNSELQDGDMVYCLLHSSESCAFQGWMMSNVVVMDVYNYPDVSIEASPNDTACITQTITLDAGNPGCDYFWSTGETTQSIVVSNTSGPSGGIQTYFVEVIKGGICSGYDTTSVYFDPCTGIKDLTAASGINIFPNPSHEDFYIQIKEIIIPVSITLLSSQGILLEEFKFMPSESDSPFNMDLAEYPDGIYFLKFQDEEKFEVRKIIKN